MQRVMVGGWQGMAGQNRRGAKRYSKLKLKGSSPDSVHFSLNAKRCRCELPKCSRVSEGCTIVATVYNLLHGRGSGCRLVSGEPASGGVVTDGNCHLAAHVALLGILVGGSQLFQGKHPAGPRWKRSLYITRLLGPGSVRAG